VSAAEIHPTPTDAEAVAITAAIDAVWPRPVVMAETQNPLRTPTWRFSARWWSVPLPARRNRPFR
jgi:hypothetical protein